MPTRSPVTFLPVLQGHEDAGGAGVDVTATARHAERRNLCWMVAIWMDRAAGGSWYATVKGEIDLDDDDGGDFCVLNEQRAVAEANETAKAVRMLSAMVANCPPSGRQAKRWSHGHHDVGDGSEDALAAVTRTVTVVRRQPEPGEPE